MVAGDEQSYTVFAPLFDKVISARHNGYPANAKHPTDLNPDRITKTRMDASGKYVLTTRIRTGRNLHGFPLPPCINFEQRRDVEKEILIALRKLEGEYKGDYYPLAGSQSTGSCMSQIKEDELRKKGNLF